MEFSVLGPLEVRHEGSDVPLGSRKQRAVLAILLLRANEVVSRDTLIDELWGERPPPTADHTFQVYVSRLRTALRSSGAGDDVLVTRPGGYLLRVAPGELDLHRFERLVEDGRRALEAGSPDRAAERLRKALSLWRGPALADVAFEPFARVDVDRLTEQRLAALEDRIEADLALGRHAALVAELESLVAEHPLRERLRGQLMTALYRCGRQADALDVYRDAREYLTEELGLEPSKGLRALERAILEQDESLEPSPPDHSPVSVLAPTAPANGSERDVGRTGAPIRAPARLRLPPPAAARSRSRRTGLALIAAGVVAATVAGVTLVKGGGRSRAPSSAGADAAVFLDPAKGELVGQSRALGRPSAIASGHGAIWVTNTAGDEVLKLDPGSRRVVDRIAVGRGPRDLTVTREGIWVVDTDGRTVSEINPSSDTVVATIAVGNAPISAASGARGIWIADESDGTITRIDPRRARVVDTIDVGQPLTDLTVGAGAVWATSSASGLLARIDPRHDRVIQTISVGNGPASVAVAGGAVWVANPPDATVSRVDPSTATVRKVDVPDAGALAPLGGKLWVAEPERLRVASIDLTRRVVVDTVRIGGSAAALTAAGEKLGAVTTATPTSHRGGTLRVAGGTGLDSIDPGQAWSATDWQVLSLTNDGLVRYARAPGAAGATILPDLATTVPAPQDGGRTFTFQLRSGIRYSTGAPVRPEDFRSAIEREYAAGTGLAAFGVRVIGGDRCSRRRCDLSRAVLVDDATRTITIRLSAPDPAFLYKLALPFGSALPAGTPPVGAARGPLPATGPYRIGRYVPGREVLLVRNPRFRPWSPGSERGFADRIAVRLGLDPAGETAAVRSGAADLTLDSPPAGAIAGLARQSPLSLQRYALPEVFAMFLNTRLPPFDRLAARRALNLAVDRSAVARLAGGPELAQPTCQVLPPGFPGYAPYCPYSAGPNAAGVWRRPDVARARRLIAASGTRGMNVTVSTVATDRVKLAAGRYVARLLKRLGYRTRLRLYHDQHAYYGSVGLARRHSQIGVFAWEADYPAGSALFPPLFTCSAYRPATPFNSNPAGFCEPDIDRAIERATALEPVNTAAAAAAWRDVDRRVARQAPWAPLISAQGVDLVSHRLGNYQRSPISGVMLDRVWVR
jgi:ABC-type transport system substrate-binding protein/DNA-binding SARP family transcriptional activator